MYTFTEYCLVTVDRYKFLKKKKDVEGNLIYICMQQ